MSVESKGEKQGRLVSTGRRDRSGVSKRAAERAKKSIETKDAPLPGRPTEYTPELADLICFKIASGSTLRDLEKDLDITVSQRTILEWNARSELGDPKYKGFARRYARARDLYFDFEAQNTVAIADEEKDPAKAKVRVQARQWIASHRIGKYRDAIEIHEGDESEGEPVEIKTPKEASTYLEKTLGIAARPTKGRR